MKNRCKCDLSCYTTDELDRELRKRRQKDAALRAAEYIEKHSDNVTGVHEKYGLRSGMTITIDINGGAD